MSRLLSRFGIRALAVTLLLVGVVGGYYLGDDRKIQQQAIHAQLASEADEAELQLVKEHHRAQMVAGAERRAAEYEAVRKAAEVAKAEAQRAKKAEQAASRKKRAAAESASTATKPYTGPIPASCKEYSGNRAIGCAVLLDSGFGLDQMPCLDKLWNKESGWNHKARNSSSGAFGIPQALPGGKMASAGDDWQTSPATQVKWGLGYIKDRYGSPCKAWSHSQSVGWY
ncbi:lytic transglycosylase domain-containing protein [Micromonospora sp. NPDC049679]|uniref:aggregation-promoting factor C-terminal-like domain-containing protein n=1 Tax=Micromonospora sp. NPDC049679 TaxID=3155920 RepID=UPI00340EA055